MKKFTLIMCVIALAMTVAFVADAKAVIIFDEPAEYYHTGSEVLSRRPSTTPSPALQGGVSLEFKQDAVLDRYLWVYNAGVADDYNYFLSRIGGTVKAALWIKSASAIPAERYVYEISLLLGAPDAEGYHHVDFSWDDGGDVLFSVDENATYSPGGPYDATPTLEDFSHDDTYHLFGAYPTLTPGVSYAPRYVGWMRNVQVWSGVVPEPSTLTALFGLLLSALFVRRRR